MALAREKGLPLVGLKAYFRIMGLWGVGEEEATVLLGFDHKPTDAEIDLDALKRISHTIGIYSALQTLLSREAADTWVKRPNSAEPFRGRPALELLLEGTQGFEAVRMYLSGVL